MGLDRWRVGTLALVVSAACASTVPEIHPEAPELKELRFSGNQVFSGDDLAKGLATHTKSGLATLDPFSRPERFDDATFQGDLDRLKVFYKSRGYFDVHILKTDVEPAGKNAVRVTVTLSEGAPSTVGEIDIEGQSGLPPELLADLQKPFPLVPGQVFDDAAYQEAKAEVLARVHEYAYAEATVEGEAVVNPGAHRVGVTFTIDAGQHFKYSRFVIRGNQRVPTARIQQELDEVPMKVGDDFQSSDLNSAQDHLFQLGVFSNVSVQAGALDHDNGTLPVLITVAEAPFQSFRVSTGLGVDIEHQEVHVSAGYTNRDFIGRLTRLDFDNTFALEWIPGFFTAIQGDAPAPAFTSVLKLTFPEIINHDIDLTTRVEGDRVAELGFGYWRAQGAVGLPWRLTKRLTFTPSYNAEVLFFDAQSFSGIDVTPAALLSLNCTTCILSFFEENLSWDLRDNAIEPTRGALFSIDVQETGAGGDFSNLRVLPDVRLYEHLGTKFVLAFRFQIGALWTGGESPVDQRFFLGGIDSVRGYGAERLSPMVRVNTCHQMVNNRSLLCPSYNNGLGILDVQVGGNGMIQGNFELRYTASELLNVVLFVDSGEVTAQPFAFDFSPNGLAITPGLGLRFKIPGVGPLRVDLAYRATDPDRPYTLVGATSSMPFGNTFPQKGYAPPPPTGASQDLCGWPFVPSTGWVGYTQPSTCKSDVLRRLALSIAIGEAF